MILTKKRVAIIGAGIAGLSCAGELEAHGFAVTLFDKSKGVGGRMSHRYFGDWEADHGAQYFTARDAIFKEEVAQWVQAEVAKPWSGRIVTLNHGNTIDKPSDATRYVGIPAMTSPAKYLANRLQVLTQHTVVDVHRINNLWKITTKEHGQIPEAFEYLVLAIPSVQAERLIGKYSANLKAICQEVVMLPCWTLLAYLKEPLHLAFDGAFVEGSVFSWLARDNSKPNRPVYETWVAQASHAWSAAHVDHTQFEIEPILIKGFQELTRVEPDLHQSHLWRYAKLEQPNEREFALDPSIAVGMCGDWLKNSTVEGAWLSGYRLAQQLKQTL
jgi:predicted NAD/FAD-dependent oxidoreductase